MLYNLLEPTPDFMKAYEHLMQVLRSLHRRLDRGEPFERLFDIADDKFERGFTGFDFGSAAAGGLDEEPSVDAQMQASIAYAIEARSAHDLGELERAWPHLVMAYYCAGRAHEASLLVLAALRRAELYIPFQQKMVALLEEECPEDLWENLEQARQAILPSFRSFCEGLPKNQAKLLKDPEQSLVTWSKSNQFRDVFAQYVKKITRGRPRKSKQTTGKQPRK